MFNEDRSERNRENHPHYEQLKSRKLGKEFRFNATSRKADISKKFIGQKKKFCPGTSSCDSVATEILALPFITCSGKEIFLLFIVLIPMKPGIFMLEIPLKYG